MIKQSLSTRKSKDEDFTVSIRQARFKINESYRESNHFIESDERLQFRKFIREKFHSVECRYFSAKEESNDERNSRCMCGEMKNFHKIDKIPYSQFNTWNEDKSIEYLSTSSFGKIEFIGEDITNSKLTDFVRVSSKDKIEDVMDLLFNKWNINIGTLCISVFGGTTNFKMNEKEKNIFCQGLIKAAITTNALILTPGLNKGITSVIGDAIQYSQSYLYDKMKHNNFICCLGITPWGYVKNRHILESARGRTVQYNVINEVEPNKPVALNKYHTHYLFVDDGYRLEMSRNRIGSFRQALENQINQKQGERDAIPVVFLVVEGGHDVFIEASRRVKKNVPIIVCEGTGRASDIIGEAYREMLRVSEKHKAIKSYGVLTLSEKYRKALKKKLVKQNVSEPNQVDEALKCIQQIISNEHLITLFDIKSNKDLDFAILYSLIKRMDYICDSQTNPLSSQLSLCLTWNRVDIVKDKIFTGDISLSNDEWAEFLKESIINGKVKFIDLFLQNVSNIENFLSTAILQELYEKCPKSYNFRKTFLRLIGRPFSKGLADVNEILSKIVGSHESLSFYETEYIESPFQELFLWAVLMEKHKCAKFFWGKCDESLFLALVATRIYKCHQGTSIKDTDRLNTLKIKKDYFEKLAVELIEECYDVNQEIAAHLIEKENPVWGGISCLQLAYKSKDLKFISNIVCQNSIKFTWQAGFNINFFHCILCIIFPYLIFAKADYRKDIKFRESLSNTSSNTSGTCSSKLKLFYLAPQTKFCIHSFIFLCFIIYFSYTVLYGMKRMTFTVHEILFMFYLVVMVLEKFIETFKSRSNTFFGRLKQWWNYNYSNKIDALIMLLAVIAMLLRLRLAFDIWKPDRVILYRCSKTFYSLIVGLFYLKILRLLTCLKKLGPKMVMMSTMLKELTTNILIFIIFLLSYGVTSQAGYYPQREFSWNAFANVFDYPYWCLFGVLSLPNNVYFNWCNASTNYSISNDCPENNILIPILFALFVIIFNILLLNLLIALNSYICNNIHENSIEIWKYNMYSLVLEYDMKSILPLPFSIIAYPFKFFTLCYRNNCCITFENRKKFEISRNETKKQIKSKEKSFRISYAMNSDSELEKLVKYYENYSQKYIIKALANEKQKSLKSGISRMELKSKLILKELENVHTKLNKGLVKSISNASEISNQQYVGRIVESENHSKKKFGGVHSLLDNINNNIIFLINEIKNSRFPTNKIDYQFTKNIRNKFEHSEFDESINESTLTDNKFRILNKPADNIGLSNSMFDINEIDKAAIIKEFKKKNTENIEQIRQTDANFCQLKKLTFECFQNIESIMNDILL